VTVQAGAIINIVRDLIPDPVYNGGGVAQPTQDGGIFRAQTLYRFLNDAVKAVEQKTGWVVRDWTALNTTAHIPHYDVNGQWHTLDEVFLNGWRLARTDEGNLLWPQTIETTQGVIYAVHNTTDHWNVRLYPAPSVSDPLTFLSISGIGATDVTCSIGSATGFLPYGFIQIDSELIQYYRLVSLQLSGLVRGVGGTTAASHAQNATITHMSCWVKGCRVPNEIVTSTDKVEVPPAFQYPLQLYVLAKCRQAENEYGEAAKLMAAFDKECNDRLLDPRWKDHQGQQVKAYGEPLFGPLAWGHVVVP
jgi:hypothetical protein